MIIRSSAIVATISTVFAVGLLLDRTIQSPELEARPASSPASSAANLCDASAGNSEGCASTDSDDSPSFADEESIEKNEGPVVLSGKITGTLRDTLHDADFPAGVADQVLKIFSPILSTNTKPRKEDHYRILYERSDAKKSPRVIAVDMTYSGSKHQVAWFPSAGGNGGKYYFFDGRPVSAASFAVPVRYTRISSRFGSRVHPVRGERHTHSGVDFAAPAGTPVLAAAHGTVQFIGTGTGYGKYVVVRHRDGYATYYGHLSRFAAQLRIGMPVKQGDALGEVGSTGTATGPHLHFELRAHNRPTDPLAKMGTQFAERLGGRARESFGAHVSDVRLQFAAADGGYSLANASDGRGSSTSQVS